MTNSFSPTGSFDQYLAPEFNVAPDDERAFELISERERNTASIINILERGQYQTFELLNGQQWFTNSSATNSNVPLYGFRTVVNLGALPNTTTLTVAHGITQLQSSAFFSRVTGFAVNPSGSGTTPKYIQFPYASPVLADNIEIWADDTNVYVKTGKNQSAFTVAYAILDYVKFS